MDFSRIFKDLDVNFKELSPMLLLCQCLIRKACISPCVRALSYKSNVHTHH